MITLSIDQLTAIGCGKHVQIEGHKSNRGRGDLLVVICAFNEFPRSVRRRGARTIRPNQAHETKNEIGKQFEKFSE